MSATPDDRDPLGPLLSAAAAGDVDAWNTVVERFTDLLWATARAHRLAPYDAADVVQTTWLRLVENLDRIEDPERLGGWLATTARRECLLVIKRGRREPAIPIDDVLDRLPAQRRPPESGLLLAERDAKLWQLFDSLTDRCRTLLRVLVSDPPPAYIDVAAALDMPIGSIGPTRARCLAALRKLAAESGALEPDDVGWDLVDDGETTSPGGAS